MPVFQSGFPAPTCGRGMFLLLQTLATCPVSPFNFNHSSGCELISCDFCYKFLDDSWHKALFIEYPLCEVFVAICYSFSFFLSFFCNFLIELWVMFADSGFEDLLAVCVAKASPTLWLTCYPLNDVIWWM